MSCIHKGNNLQEIIKNFMYEEYNLELEYKSLFDVLVPEYGFVERFQKFPSISQLSIYRALSVSLSTENLLKTTTKKNGR